MTFCASILSLNVDIPDSTIIPPDVARKPFLAVTIPIASTFVTSSYDKSPVTLKLPSTNNSVPL